MSQFKILKQARLNLSGLELIKLVDEFLIESDEDWDTFFIAKAPEQYRYISWDKSLLVSANASHWLPVSDPSIFWPELMRCLMEEC